jgi:hypothetical protein
MSPPKIEVPPDKVQDFCLRNRIWKLSLCGSILTPRFRADSDIDPLVEFEPGHVPGFELVRMERELSHFFGRKVDLRTPEELSRYFRDEVIASTVVQ